ncbi:MAG: transglutaminase domain-containing protein [Theionarchaea archaeon]|nr:transglutaminase domain-containing protein [Theionarchaea archaeon]
MNKYILAGLFVLIGISIVSSYYTHTLETQEAGKGQSLSQEITQTKNTIATLTSEISQTEQKILETDPLILEEQEKQEEIQNIIDTLDLKESELQEALNFYEKIATKDPRVLITLDDPVVKAKVEEVTRLSRTTEEKQQAIFEYVRKEITYVTEGNPKEWKYPQPFLQFKPEFWQLPRETIEWGSGDCEDQSILLCTMMRIAGVPASDVRVVLGILHVSGSVGGHAWVEFKMGDTWFALESTSVYFNYMEKSEYYSLLSPDIMGWFNDEEYYEEESWRTGGLVIFLPV